MIGAISGVLTVAGGRGSLMKVRELVIGAAVGASAAYVAAARGKGSGHGLADIRGALRELGDGQASDRGSLMRQVEALLRGQEEMLEFIRSVLDDEAVAGGYGTPHRRRVISVSVRVGDAEDVMRGLVGSFCDGIGMEVILQAEEGAGGRGPYLVWRPPDGRPLENVLAAVLAAVPRECCGDHGPAIPGLDELRRLLLALHEQGTGTIRIGPLMLVRTARALRGRVMSPRELAGLGPWDGQFPGSGSALDKAALDLAPWADGYRFFAA
jgi:hypothetical protein